jgi:hypothetical protein
MKLLMVLVRAGVWGTPGGVKWGIMLCSTSFLHHRIAVSLEPEHTNVLDILDMPLLYMFSTSDTPKWLLISSLPKVPAVDGNSIGGFTYSEYCFGHLEFQIYERKYVTTIKVWGRLLFLK